MKIFNRYDGTVIYEEDVASMKLLVLSAIGKGISLSNSDLSNSNLSNSNLRYSNLSNSDLSGSNLTPIRDDFWAVLSSVPSEVAALREKIVAGEINGSTYKGECACLVGTIANARLCTYQEIPGLSPNASRPIERFFTAITPGKTPENHEPSRIVLEWLDTWVARMTAAFGPKNEMESK